MHISTQVQPGKGLAVARSTGRLARVAAYASLAIFLLHAGVARAQYTAPTAIKRAEIQVGGGVALADSDASQNEFRGASLYGTYDFSPHFGVEFMFHQVNTQHEDQIYERTYELGPRYVRHYGRFNPYVRAAYGRGVFNYYLSSANLAYNLFTAAGGVDVRIQRHFYARGEYEFQRWLNFPPHGLQPSVITIGGAYRF